jgi:hypothetical protein
VGACLVDRVRLHEKRPQVYGTQLSTVDGVITPGELEDAAHVDERRASVGLGPLREDVAMMKQMHETE